MKINIIKRTINASFIKHPSNTFWLYTSCPFQPRRFSLLNFSPYICVDKIPDMSDSINGIDTFKELYTDYFQAVWGFCNTYLKDREQAMDATQETFFKLYERLDDSYTCLLYTSDAADE